MSVSYQLHIDSSLDAELTLKNIFNNIEFQNRKLTITGDGMPCMEAKMAGFYVIAVDVPHDFDPYLGFAASVYLSFNYNAGHIDWLMQAIFDFLLVTPVDLALLLDDYFSFTHISKALKLNKDEGFWTPERLTMIKQPYTIEKIPFLGMKED